MRAEEAREIDRLARSHRNDRNVGPGCLPAPLITIAAWAVIIAVVLRLQQWGRS